MKTYVGPLNCPRESAKQKYDKANVFADPFYFGRLTVMDAIKMRLRFASLGRTDTFANGPVVLLLFHL